MKLALVVTEDEAAFKLYAVRLKQAGWSATSATTLEDAVRLLETAPELPNVIVVDLYMRRKSEVAALERLRTSRHSAAIPLVLLGTDRLDASATTWFAAILPKPLSPGDVAATVSRLSPTSDDAAQRP